MSKSFTQSSESKILSILLALWIYTYALFYFIPLIIPSTTMLMYIWLVMIDILILSITRSLSRRVFGFLFVYTIYALVNTLVVSYKYYVIIEAFTGMAVFLPAILIIGSLKFNLKEFLQIWYKFAIISTVFSPIAVILMQKKIIDYGVFTYLNLPNSIIFAYIIMCANKGMVKKKISVVLAIINFFIILFFGGRMAAFSAAFSIFIAYMFSMSVKPLKKYCFLSFLLLFSVIILNNLDVILQGLEVFLKRYNLHSRTLALLLEQIGKNGTGIYMTGRNNVYDETLLYIKDRLGLPGGFGVNLHISSGKFYHPHNLFLQLTLIFGIVGGILVLILMFFQLIKIKKNKEIFEYKFTLFLVVEYLIFSLTGGSILNNFIAIIGIGMIFFYQGRETYIEKI